MPINLDPDKPLPKRQPSILLTPDEEQVVDKYIKDMLQKGWIYKIQLDKLCPVATLVFFVGKKDGGAWMVTDYWDINKITILDIYPILIMYKLLDKLLGGKYFFILDMQLGYNNLQIQKLDEWKAAFKVKNQIYILLVIMFRIKNSLSVF